MRAETLVFLHMLAAATLLGALLAVAVFATANGAAAQLAGRSSVAVAVAALATTAIGEATRAREDAAGTWLDVASVLGYAGLLLPSFALVVVARKADADHRWQARTAGLAWSMTIVALSATFVMAAKPF